MTTKRRPRGAEPAVQGELEMTADGAPADGGGVEAAAVAGDGEAPAGSAGIPPAEAELAGAAAPSDGGAPRPSNASATEAEALEADADPDDDGRLAGALEGLDRRVTLLVQRYEELVARHGRTIEERTADRAALERLAGSGASPAELDGRIRHLEAENERLARHAGFLEERIQGLLARVRYVIEA